MSAARFARLLVVPDGPGRSDNRLTCGGSGGGALGGGQTCGNDGPPAPCRGRTSHSPRRDLGEPRLKCSRLVITKQGTRRGATYPLTHLLPPTALRPSRFLRLAACQATRFAWSAAREASGSRSRCSWRWTRTWRVCLPGHRVAEQLSTAPAPPAPASRPRATPGPHASAARASSSRAVRVRPDDCDDPRGRGGRRPGPPEQGGQGEGVRLRQGRARRGSRRRVPDWVRLGARSRRCAAQAGAGPRRAAQHQRGDRKEHRRGVRQVLPECGHRAHRQPRQLGRARHVRTVEEGCAGTAARQDRQGPP